MGFMLATTFGAERANEVVCRKKRKTIENDFIENTDENLYKEN